MDQTEQIRQCRSGPRNLGRCGFAVGAGWPGRSQRQAADFVTGVDSSRNLNLWLFTKTVSLEGSSLSSQVKAFAASASCVLYTSKSWCGASSIDCGWYRRRHPRSYSFGHSLRKVWRRRPRRHRQRRTHHCAYYHDRRGDGSHCRLYSRNNSRSRSRDCKLSIGFYYMGACRESLACGCRILCHLVRPACIRG